MTLKEPYVGLMIHEYTKKVIQEGKRPKLDKKIPIELNELMETGWQRLPSSRPCMRRIHESLIRFQDDYKSKASKKK